MPAMQWLQLPEPISCIFPLGQSVRSFLASSPRLGPSSGKLREDHASIAVSASANPLDSSHGARMHTRMSFTLQTSSAAADNPAVLTSLAQFPRLTAARPILMSPARSPDRLTNFRRALHRHCVGTEESFESILETLLSSLSVPGARFCAQPSLRW